VYEKTNIIYEERNMQQLEDIEKITIFEKEGKERCAALREIFCRYFFLTYYYNAITRLAPLTKKTLRIRVGRRYSQLKDRWTTWTIH
jgi:hypothetical protein